MKLFSLLAGFSNSCIPGGPEIRSSSIYGINSPNKFGMGEKEAHPMQRAIGEELMQNFTTGVLKCLREKRRSPLRETARSNDEFAMGKRLAKPLWKCCWSVLSGGNWRMLGNGGTCLQGILWCEIWTERKSKEIQTLHLQRAENLRARISTNCQTGVHCERHLLLNQDRNQTLTLKLCCCLSYFNFIYNLIWDAEKKKSWKKISIFSLIL